MAAPSDRNRIFAKRLLAWYRVSRRDLPWRKRQDDPYAVWISEIMLQQTTVNAVIGFYNRWMQRFPTVATLAYAPLDEVLRYWAGLGYYARARNIKKTAEHVVANLGGVFPSAVDELMKLPGIGRYTAGAVSSIAFNQNAPIVDANVTRVLCRVAVLEGDPKLPLVQRELWRLAETLIPDGDARDFNQGLMELGASLCSPKSPNCAACPISEFCEAYLRGIPELFPTESDKKSWKTARHAATAIFRPDGKLLIIKRPESGVWAGFWELPRVIAADGEEIREAALRAAREVAGIRLVSPVYFATVKHVVMDTKITLAGFRAELPASQTVSIPICEHAWICPEQITMFAVSSPQKKLIELLGRNVMQENLGI